MDFGLAGKKAVVLASSKGLGKAVAMELASEGAHVFLNGRNGSDLEQTAEEIRQQCDVDVYYVVGDVSKSEDRSRIISEVNSRFGSADILVTNSGGPPPGAFETLEDEDWGQAYRLLLESTVGIIRGLLPGMKQNKWGRIITITSQAIKQPVNGLILSNAVRASLLGLVKTLSNELGSFNITVNNVMPGYTQTQRLDNLFKVNPGMEQVTGDIPLGRIGQPGEFAAAVAFLASERASYITGVSLAVDGGWIKGI